jgi:hypothetical protein
MLFLKYECRLNKECFLDDNERYCRQIAAKSEAVCASYKNASRLCYVKAQGAECTVVGVFTSYGIYNKSCDDILVDFLLRQDSRLVHAALKASAKNRSLYWKPKTLI